MGSAGAGVGTVTVAAGTGVGPRPLAAASAGVNTATRSVAGCGEMQAVRTMAKAMDVRVRIVFIQMCVWWTTVVSARICLVYLAGHIF